MNYIANLIDANDFIPLICFLNSMLKNVLNMKFDDIFGSTDSNDIRFCNKNLQKFEIVLITYAPLHISKIVQR